MGSRRPAVLEELNRGGVLVLTAAPELGGPAGLLCLSHSLPLLLRGPWDPLLVLPAHAPPHPVNQQLPGGPTRLSHASSAGLPALGQFFLYFFMLQKALLFPLGPRLERGLQGVKKLPSGCREGLQAALMLGGFFNGHWSPEAPSRA